MTGARYTQLSAAFWEADPATAGLSPLAACVLLRARSASLVGVLRASPRAIASAHNGVTAADVERAIAELVARGLVGWWPDSEFLASVGWAQHAKGKAAKAAELELAALPPAVAAIASGQARPDDPPDGASDGASRQQEHQHYHQHHEQDEDEHCADPDGDHSNVDAPAPVQLVAEPALAASVALSVQVAKQEEPPPEVASLPLRLIPEQPEDRDSTRGLARRLWEWHERERIARLHGGKGTPRKPLDREHLDRIVSLVRKVAKQEGILERPAFLRVHEFRRRAIEQARLALAGEDPAWARKLVAWCRNESAWSLKAYDSVMAAEADALAVASSRPVSPPGTIDGDPLSAVEATAWRDAFSSTGDAGIARLAVVALRRSPDEPRGVIDVTSPPAKVHNPFAIGGAK